MAAKELSDQDRLEAVTAAHVLDADIFRTWSKDKRRQVVLDWNEILREPQKGDADV